ncbi:MAG: hypothetical protein JNM91_01725 [Flavobacteriales bacterium]|nr:hypothetical protein [Flavobacteriales bacterium]
MRSLLLLLIAVIAVLRAHGQESIYDDEGRTLYSREMYGGPIIHGDGWGGQFWYGKYRTAADRHMFGFELVGMKHPKEIKSYNPFYEDSRGYFYGKMNSMLVLRPTYGRKHRITEKIRRSGVEVNYVWGLGPSLALLKPVYLQIGYRIDGREMAPYDNIVEERYDPDKHRSSNIFGRASWFRGLGELSVVPGVFGRAGLNFEYAGDNTGIRALEVGATVDAYPERIPIMSEEEEVINKRIFLQFYIAMHFGSKTIR